MATYVSRGGEKLSYALEHFEIDVDGKICADLGSSTGGFVDCLRQCGAKKVYSIDTAYGELAWKLRSDPRVVVMERTNALHVQLPEKVGVVTIDVGWTRQEKIVPYACSLLKKGGVIVTLLKPSYEVTDSQKNRQELDGEKVMKDVVASLGESGINIRGTVKSPIAGKRGGSVEYFLYVTA